MPNPITGLDDSIPGMRSVSVEERIGLRLAPDGTVSLDAWPVGSSVLVTTKGGKRVKAVTESLCRLLADGTVVLDVSGHGEVPVGRVEYRG